MKWGKLHDFFQSFDNCKDQLSCDHYQCYEKKRVLIVWNQTMSLMNIVYTHL